jgi:hypothetical protein
MGLWGRIGPADHALHKSLNPVVRQSRQRCRVDLLGSPKWEVDLANILELRSDGAGVRYYLDGIPVDIGSQIQLQVYCGNWISGLFEWEQRVEIRPKLRASLGLHLPAPQATFVIHPHLLLRWPIVSSPEPARVEGLRQTG